MNHAKSLMLKNGKKLRRFKSLQDASRFLKVRPEIILLSEAQKKKVDGWTITFVSTFVCQSCNTKIDPKDDYCFNCYYEELTGKKPFSDPTILGNPEPMPKVRNI